MTIVHSPDPGPPGPGQVCLRMRLAPVNPADRLVAAGSYAPIGGLPETIGAEGMGVVDALGPGVSGVTLGQRVMLLSRGNWATHRLVAAAELLPLPDSLDDAQASMLRINPATAALLLARLALDPGDILIQNAPRASVAMWVRRLGARGGLNVIGADEACDRPIRAAIDAVAGEATGALAERLAPGGEILVYGHLSGRPCTIASTLLTAKSVRLSGFSLRPAEAAMTRAAMAGLYQDLAALAAEAPEPIAAIFPIDAVEDAIAAAAARGRQGRILLDLGG